MRKRALCLVLTLVMMLGMVPVAHAGYICDNSYEATVITYYEAMVRYDMAMNSPDNPIWTPDNVFLDPHEAWENYLATETRNNWFFFWYEYGDKKNAYRDHHNYYGLPTSYWYTDNEDTKKWWDRMDAYLTDVQADKEHVVDKDTIYNSGSERRLAKERITDEDRLWIEWKTIKSDAAQGVPACVPFSDYTFQEWKDFKGAMASDELDTFNQWKNDLSTAVMDKPTWEQWKEQHSPANDPVTVSTHSAGEPNEDTKTTAMAYANTQTITIDGNPVTFPCYALKDENGNLTNYVRIRDLAMALKDTRAHFSVDWKDDTVSAIRGLPYEPNGSEFSTPFSGDRPCQVDPVPWVHFDINTGTIGSQAIILTDNNGGGYTYYSLRFLASELHFNVGWSADRGVFIETYKTYTPHD